MLKMIPLEEGPYELEVNRLLSTEPLASNPRNRCAPLLDVIQLPNEPPIMVHPLLRPFYNPRFQTFGEFVSFFAQACEVSPVLSCTACIGLGHICPRPYNSCMKTMLRTGMSVHFSSLMSRYLISPTLHHIRDCTSENIMLDPTNMYPKSFHPVALGRSKDFRRRAKAYTRTRRPSRYVLIDFGLSRRYDPANGPPVDVPIHGGDKSAPELQEGKTSYNPFPTDVYYLGNLVREDYMQVRHFLCLDKTMFRPTRPEILWVRVYERTHCGHGPRRSHEASHHGRCCCPYFRDQEEAKYMEGSLSDGPQKGILAP